MSHTVQATLSLDPQLKLSETTTTSTEITTSPLETVTTSLEVETWFTEVETLSSVQLQDAMPVQVACAPLLLPLPLARPIHAVIVAQLLLLAAQPDACLLPALLPACSLQLTAPAACQLSSLLPALLQLPALALLAHDCIQLYYSF